MLTISFEALNINIRKAGKQEKASWKGRERRIYDHEMMLCIKGELHYQDPEGHYQIGEGQVLIIKPNIPHQLWVNTEIASDIIWIHFDYYYRNDREVINNVITTNHKVLFNGELPNSRLLREDVCIDGRYVLPKIITLINKSEATQYMRQVLEFYKEQYPTWQLDAKIILLKLFQMIIREQNQLQIGGQFGDNKVDKRIKEYIHHYYYRPITVKQLGNYLGYHPDYLGKTFKKYNAMSITQYVHQVRMEHAKELLKKTDLSIANIAEELGYSSSAYFTHQFIRDVGISPMKWKKQKI